MTVPRACRFSLSLQSTFISYWRGSASDRMRASAYSSPRSAEGPNQASPANASEKPTASLPRQTSTRRVTSPPGETVDGETVTRPGRWWLP